MGSVGAMARGSADRYFQAQDIKDSLKLVAGRRRGPGACIAYKGAAATVLHQLVGGLRAAMGYVGAKNSMSCTKRRSSCASPVRRLAQKATCMM